MKMNKKKKSYSLVACGVIAAVLLTGSTSWASPKSSAKAAKSTLTTSIMAAGLPDVAAPETAVKLSRAMLKGKKVRMVIYGVGYPLSDNWVNSMKVMFKQVGADFVVKDANFKAPQLAVDLENFINQKPDLLLVHNTDVSSLASLMKKAQKAGIYVISINLNSNQQTDAFVGPDWGVSGTLIGERIAKDCKAKGKTDIAIIGGFGNDSQGVVTVPAAVAVFKKNGLKVVFNQIASFDANKAQALTATALQQYPNLCAVLGVWDGMTGGASAAVVAAGKSKQVGVYTIDSSQPTCDLIMKGEMTATVSQGAQALGYIVAGISEYLLQSGHKPGLAKTAIYLPQQLIDSTNAASACYSATPK